jgi:hypothetical protein
MHSVIFAAIDIANRCLTKYIVFGDSAEEVEGIVALPLTLGLRTQSQCPGGPSQLLQRQPFPFASVKTMLLPRFVGIIK